MSRGEPRPFQQRKPSLRERRDSERRARARAAALAEALPPPDAALRVDPDNPSRPAPAAAAGHSPDPVASGRRPLSQVGLYRPEAGAVPEHVSSPAHPLAATPAVPSWSLPAQRSLADADAGAEADPLGASPWWRRPWQGRAATFGLPFFLLVGVLGFVLALGWGAPVLGHGLQWPLVSGGAGAVAVSAWAVSRCWGQLPVRACRAGLVVAVTLCAAFAVGVATNPVVVDGRVFLSTSPQAKQFELMTQIHQDLLRMRQLDVYLTYSPADAGAHYNEYAPALDELAELSNRYARLGAQDLPDPRFADAVGATKSAAYWARQAMEAKVSLLTQDDARTAANVTTFRADFAEQYVAAGRALSFLSADLNIPLETREHE